MCVFMFVFTSCWCAWFTLQSASLPPFGPNAANMLLSSFPLSACRYSCCHCRPLTSYPRHPTHTYIYTFTLISKQHAIAGQKYGAVCAATKQLCRASERVGRAVLLGRLHILKMCVIDTCTDAHTLKITLGHCYLTPSHPPTHTAAAGQPASWHRSI